jgi:hypothetical protein
MNKNTAKKIAETITFKQLQKMFLNAKENITDWEQVSSVNQLMTKGMAWNILYPGLNEDMRYRSTCIKNMIWEFGDHLDEELIPKKKKKVKLSVAASHQDPIF